MQKHCDGKAGAGGIRGRGIDGIAAYVGISAPETPKYLLTNNFLLDYFERGREGRERYGYERFKAMGVLQTEDEGNEERMKDAFDRFMDRYLGSETIRNENRRLSKSDRHQFYFPITPDMLTESVTASLRHLLLHLQSLDDGFRFEEFGKALAEYVFKGRSGIMGILKILLDGNAEPVLKKGPEINENFWDMLSQPERSSMKRLGCRLNEDLRVILNCPEFTRQDFYRRYQYLSILLTSYVIQYFLVRKGRGSCLLCKGDVLDGRLGGNLHRACYNNYVMLRNLFPELLQKYFLEAVEELVDEDGKLKLVFQDNTVLIGGESFWDFTGRLSGGRRRQRIEERQILEAFGLIEEGRLPEEGKEFPLRAEDFVLRYISLTGSRKGSTLTKISSTLSTCGRQIDMVFPKSNARHKYFAMSGSLAEFHVRLYLAGKGQQYDYLDNFLDHLTERYHIVLTNSQGSERLLKSVKPRLSALELSRNKAAFVDNLNRINCLIKLSDSGYVVTLPEEKGDFTLI